MHVVDGQGFMMIRLFKSTGAIDRVPIVAFYLDPDADSPVPDAQAVTGDSFKHPPADCWLGVELGHRIVDRNGDVHASEAAFVAAHMPFGQQP
jgi:hypothetical protein